MLWLWCWLRFVQFDRYCIFIIWSLCVCFIFFPYLYSFITFPLQPKPTESSVPNINRFHNIKSHSTIIIIERNNRTQQGIMQTTNGYWESWVQNNIKSWRTKSEKGQNSWNHINDNIIADSITILHYKWVFTHPCQINI